MDEKIVMEVNCDGSEKIYAEHGDDLQTLKDVDDEVEHILEIIHGCDQMDLDEVVMHLLEETEYKELKLDEVV